MASPRKTLFIATVLSATTAITFACGDFSEQTSGATTPDLEGGADGPAKAADGSLPVPPCDAAKVDSDPNHCGRCGHSCLGGACVAGTCKPSVFVPLAAVPRRIALDEARVVWSDGTNIFHCAKSGCNGAPASLVGSGLGYTDLAGSAKFTFYASGGGNNAHVGELGLDDGYAQLGPAIGFPFLVHSDGTVVVALNSAGSDPRGGLFVGHAGMPGSLVHVAPQLLPGETTARNWGYVTTNGSRAFAGDYGTIHTCTLPTCAGWTVAAGGAQYIDGVSGIAATATDLFWTSFSAPYFNTCPLATATTSGCNRGSGIAGSKLPAGAAAHDVFLEDGRLYVTAGDTIGSCDPASCDATWLTHVQGGDIVRGRPAADTTAIYWVAYEVPPAPDASTDPDAAAPAPLPPTSVRIMKLAK